MSNTNRREFMQLMGITAVMSTLKTNIARALEIPANTAPLRLASLRRLW